jgi:hypothetical protein
MTGNQCQQPQCVSDAVVLQWCYSGATVVLQWCYSGDTCGRLRVLTSMELQMKFMSLSTLWHMHASQADKQPLHMQLAQCRTLPRPVACAGVVYLLDLRACAKV